MRKRRVVGVSVLVGLAVAMVVFLVFYSPVSLANSGSLCQAPFSRSFRRVVMEDF